MGETSEQPSLTSTVSGHGQHNQKNIPAKSTSLRNSMAAAVSSEEDAQRWDVSLLDSCPASSVTFKRDRRVVRCVQPRDLSTFALGDS